MKWLKNDRGFTVVELLAAVLIGGMMLAVIGSFLTTHVISFDLNTEIVNVQQEGQFALNKIMDVALDSKGIVQIDNSDDLSATDAVNIQSFLLEDTNNNYHRFRVDSNSLKYAKSQFKDFNDNPNEIILSRNILDLTLRAGDTDFLNCKSLYIELDLQDGDAKLEVTNQVRFRNKQ